MKTRRQVLQRLVAVILMLSVFGALEAANTKKSVTKVSEPVTITEDWDYIISGATPFDDGGLVNLQNTDHAVLILNQVKPSQAIRLLADHVQIGGERAVNNTNCQVKLYNRGCIILPYGTNTKPLTVWSEKNFEGESANNFGLGNDGGFMLTLTAAQLNNRIRSFKLKRGYMVTFANRAKGRGYSRCFIADKADLEVSELPGVLDNSISSYRIFKWYDTGKQALANDTRASSVSALNVTSCYSFGLGESRLPDAECVPHHIYEDWPSAAACGQVTYSPHLKTNNEPGNSADDHPQSVEEILNNWENLMATGMRLCSPSSHDGSLQHLRDFLTEVDKRGWRCDIIDLHCYWPEWNFSNSIKTWADNYKRPIWISEWVWGASWNNNGIFGEAQGSYRNNPTTAQLNKNKEVVSRICSALNGFDYIERYYYWNSEANCSKILRDGNLTPAGEMYSEINSGLAYNGKINYIPSVPTQYDPANFSVDYDSKEGKAVLTWHDYNGELNSSMVVLRRADSNASWETLATIELQEEEADYTFTDEQATNGNLYRIQIIDANNKTRSSAEVMAVATDLVPGDAIIVDGQTKYLGGSLLPNGDFDMGLYGWTDGAGNALAMPWFEWMKYGGVEDGSYLQAFCNAVTDGPQVVKTSIAIKPQADYYFSGAACCTTSNLGQLIVGGEAKVSIANMGELWATRFGTFNSGDSQEAVIYLRQMGGKAQFDRFMLCQLFDSKEEAIADGIEKMRLQATAFAGWNTLLPSLNDDLTALLSTVTSTGEQGLAETSAIVAMAFDAYDDRLLIDSLLTVADAIKQFELYGQDELDKAVEDANNATTIAEVGDACYKLKTQIESMLPLVALTDKVASPDFTSSTGWTTKCGTHTAGDQRTNTHADGTTFWNAWWSGINASEGTNKTMEIKQEVTELPSGLYVLSCKATTDHYCTSDQHAYITNGTTTAVSPVLTHDYFDLNVSKDVRWQTLTTTPVYVEEGGSLTIGFVGSKKGAVDNAWHRIGTSNATGDKREGWWCATDFQLNYVPLYRTTVEPQQWATICLPYGIHSGGGIQLYNIVGITSDFSRLCLEPVEQTEPGVPCMYKADRAEVSFLEYGEAVTSAKPGVGNLRGFFQTMARVPQNYFILENGEWRKVTESADRPKLVNYTAVMRPLTDNQSTVFTVYSDWEGETIAITGLSEEELALLQATAIKGVGADAMPAADGVYSLDGRTVKGAQKGLYIKVENGQVRKTVINRK